MLANREPEIVSIESVTISGIRENPDNMYEGIDRLFRVAREIKPVISWADSGDIRDNHELVQTHYIKENAEHCCTCSQLFYYFAKKAAECFNKNKAENLEKTGGNKKLLKTYDSKNSLSCNLT